MIRRLALATTLALVPATAFAQADTEQARPIARADISAKLDTDYADLDANKDGKASADEIKARLKKGGEEDLALIAKERDATFAKFDANKDGSITRAEFDAGAPLPTLKQADAAPVMSRFDANKDGVITKDEFRAPTLTNFDRMDINKDGTLSLTEQSAEPSNAKRPAPKQTPAIRRR